jgi:K(+)-stimulated pyrophosphate-energized sodium pump
MFSLPGATPFEVIAIWCVLVIAFFGLAYAMFLRKQVMLCDKGTEKMKDVWDGSRYRCLYWLSLAQHNFK